MTDTMRLRIPAKQSMMLVARMALTGYVNQCGADVDTLDDVRTLSDEACFCLMNQPAPVQAIDIEAQSDCANVHMRFSAVGDCDSPPSAPPHDPEIARGILSTLATQVCLKLDCDQVRAIELIVRVKL